MIQNKEELNKINNLFENQDINYRLINFPVKESIKINPYFNSLKMTSN